MTTEFVVEMGQRTIEMVLMLAAPALVFSVVVGLVVSVLQAVTQINEATLTFLPKILAVALAFVLFLPWMISLMVGFTTTILGNIPMYVR
ncbi:MAG: flagellar biosynthesis protein FliQ [Nitrospirota bacterium]